MTAPSATRLPTVLDLPEERVFGWGMLSSATSPIARPTTVSEIRRVFESARARGVSVGLRGTGCSYGDANINGQGIVLDLTRMNRILSFDSKNGVLRAEPGVTIEQVWRTALPEGFWPPVVPGTMFPTLGGCAAMNIHGKNNFQAGTIGRHIESFELMLPDGTLKNCSRVENSELFHAAIGGFGMLGCFTSLTISLKRVHSGDLWVRPAATSNIGEMIDFFEEHHRTADYLVGWVDVVGGGRGLIHEAWYVNEGDEASEASTLSIAHQELPSRFFWVIPKSWMWMGLWCFWHRPGVRLINAIKYYSGRRHARKAMRHRQALVAFSFLLDYVPRWKLAYRPGALIQYQTFVPKQNAASVFESQFRLAREHGVLPFLGVLKKHLPDPFLMTHAVDGYSLALDFPVTKRNKARLWKLARAMDAVVIEGGGRFYFAKDSTLDPEGLRRAYPAENLQSFRDLKRALDPHGLLQTDLSRRVLFES